MVLDWNNCMVILEFEKWLFSRDVEWVRRLEFIIKIKVK